MIDSQIVWCIAQKIRSTRLEKNLTIQKLAARTHARTHLSKGCFKKKELAKAPFAAFLRDTDTVLRNFLKRFFLGYSAG